MCIKFLTALLLSTGFSVLAVGQPTLIGKWKRVNKELKYQGVKIKQSERVDLEIRSDSTFHISGDTTSQNSTTPGWHTGEEYNGTWEQRDSTHLILWMLPKEDKMLLSYKIIKLSKQKLVLRLTFSKSTKHDTTYLRL